ncbi:MAG: hypothetical protein HC892_07405 [Saprospiraceae bacterium]|nr:hypothetical protein [Saprospiraceae bacterium]
MEQFTTLIGRFHPLLVHLPIGILLVATLFDLLSYRKRYANLKFALPLLYLLGALGAIVSCITGYLLSTSGEYEAQTVNPHQWGGIAVAVLAASVYWNKKTLYLKTPIWNQLHALLVAGLLFWTGHLGGSLTHGADYLIQPLPDSVKTWLGMTTIEKIAIQDVQAARAYSDIVVPILAEKCYNCHNANKQKGKLRLDTPEWIQQGGKSKLPLLVAGRAKESELIRRLTLPTSDEKHMPPKSKLQLSEAEIELLSWWIDNGASFEQQVKEIPQPAHIQPLLAALEDSERLSEEEQKPEILYAGMEAEPANAEDVKKLNAIRAVVLPVGTNSNLLSVNFVNVEPISKEHLTLLLPLKQQLVWLRLSEKNISDEDMDIIAQLPHLTKLYLDYTQISDAGLQKLAGLQHLEYLNLVGTNSTKKGIEALKTISSLKQLYLFQTKITTRDYLELSETFKTTEIDTGGYALPNLN